MNSRRLAFLVALIAQPLAAEPRSAIPWLSESLRAEETRNWAEAPSPGRTEEVEASALDVPTLEGIGLLTPSQTGFPSDLWGKSTVDQVQTAILDHRLGGVPETRAAFLRVLLAETKPPLGSGKSPDVLLARLDRLLDMGALDQAEALLSHTGIESHELFRRAFDVAILTERTSSACTALRSTPSLSPTFPARIFCLARDGDWNAAELTLTIGQTIGTIPDDKAATLAWFLDPQLFEGSEEPPIPEPLTALDFVLRDSVALPRPSGPLPMAFLHLDINEEAPMRARIEAGERLVRAGVVAPNVLFHAYRAGKPAASGGVWDRAAAVQSLDRALSGGESETIVQALENADHRLSDHGLRLAFAQSYAGPLARLRPAMFPRTTQRQIFELLLLAGDARDAMDWHSAQQDPRQQLLMHLIDAETSLPEPDRLSDVERATMEGLSELPPGFNEEAEFIVQMASSGEPGLALMRVLSMLEPGLETDPGDLRIALHILKRIGLNRTASRIALETLLLQPRA